MKNKKIDAVVLAALLFFASVYAYITNGLFIGRTLIVGAVFTLPPIIYLSWRKKKDWKKIWVSTLVFGGLFAIPLDFIADYNKSWTVISLVFPGRILGVQPVDNILGFMLMTMLTVIFYEHFVDRDKNHHLSKNLKYAVLPGIAASVIVIVLYLYHPSSLLHSYPYLYMGLAAIVPPVILGFKHPRLIKKMSVTAIYFFFFYLIFEFFAVTYKYWIYEGNNYIGQVSLVNITFPFEELFFWMMFYAASLVSYYEIFIDDEK
jgi:hypothetical protein